MIWMAAGMALSAAGGIYSGVSANKAAKKQAALQRKQAELLYEEAQRDAAKTYEEAVRFSAEQKMAYLSNGVEASGTAAATVQQTIAWGREEADAIIARGKAELDLGYAQAKITKSTGKAQMISSIMGAAGGAMSSTGSMKASAAAG